MTSGSIPCSFHILKEDACRRRARGTSPPEPVIPKEDFGPGDVRYAHSADEHVSLAEIADCARVLAAWVVNELGAPDGL